MQAFATPRRSSSRPSPSWRRSRHSSATSKPGSASPREQVQDLALYRYVNGTGGTSPLLALTSDAESQPPTDTYVRLATDQNVSSADDFETALEDLGRTEAAVLRQADLEQAKEDLTSQAGARREDRPAPGGGGGAAARCGRPQGARATPGRGAPPAEAEAASCARTAAAQAAQAARASAGGGSGRVRSSSRAPATAATPVGVAVAAMPAAVGMFWSRRRHQLLRRHLGRIPVGGRRHQGVDLINTRHAGRRRRRRSGAAEAGVARRERGLAVRQRREQLLLRPPERL